MNARLPIAALAVAALVTSGCLPSSKSGRGFHLPSGNAEKGKAAFVQLKCTGCHVVDGVELAAPTSPRMHVALGGTVRRTRTYGEFVTAIIDPSRELTLPFPADKSRLTGGSPMKDVNDQITVQQLIDIVTFLEQHYQVMAFSAEEPMRI